jgi:hypothetical protein
MQWTILFTAKPMPVLIDMAEDIIETLDTDHILGLPAGNPLSRFAPVNYLSVQITNIDPFAERVHNHLDI